MGRTKEKREILRKYGQRKFNGKIFKLVNIVEYKKQAKRSATQRKARGYNVRIVPINDDYAIYARHK